MATDTSPLVVISVINWNDAEDTLKCLASLARLSYPHFEVVLVENGSNDGSLERLSAYQAPYPFHILRQYQNLGFSGGHNAGMHYARERAADFIFLLNNDAVVAPDILNKFLEEAEKNPKIGILGPSIYYLTDGEQTDRLWFGGGRMDWLDIAEAGKHKTKLSAQQISQTQFITGCALFLRREVYEKIGELDERFFLYFEDIDYNLRAQKEGFGIALVPSAKVWHKVSATTMSQVGSPGILYYHHRNGMLLAEKDGPVFIKIYMHAWAFTKLCKQGAKLLIRKDVPVAHAISQGILDYYRGIFGKLSKRFV